MFRNCTLLPALLIALTGCTLTSSTDTAPKSTNNQANREIPTWRIVNPVRFHEQDGVVFSEEGRGIDCSKTKNIIYFSGEVVGVEWIGAAQCDTGGIPYFADVVVAIKGLRNDQVPLLANARPLEPENRWSETRYVDTNATKEAMCVDSGALCQEANTKLIDHPAYSRFTADSSQTIALSSSAWLVSSRSDFNYGLFDPWVGIEQNHEPSSLANTSRILFEGTNYDNVLALNPFAKLYDEHTELASLNQFKAIATHKDQQWDVQLFSAIFGLPNEDNGEIKIVDVDIEFLVDLDVSEHESVLSEVTYILDTGKEIKWYGSGNYPEQPLLYTYTREELSNFSLRVRTPYKLESLRRVAANALSPSSRL